MKNNGYVWGAVIAVVIIGGVILFRANKAGAPSPTASSTSTGTTTVDLGNGQSVTLPPGVTIQQIGTTTQGSSTTKPPSLTGAIVISPSLASDVQAALRTNEQTLITQLKAAPTRVDLWLRLGTYRKIAGDYAGAQVAWQYVANNPSNISYVAYGNLGELNLDFLKNYPKAESDYKTAIDLQPSVIDYYRELFLMYTTVYKTNTTAAAEIIAQGLKANPNNPDLLNLQKQLQTK